jgi:GalNAc-alpha-(1->4)-GalNAc-alpha-(1->3)-diNAcBac-PP-undecaprenol alpha-1,4-N-acetyl-D-galactosaminyltransferase
MKRKILFINNGLAGGGTERASVGLANFFAAKGFIVLILALYKSQPFYSIDPSIRFIEPQFSRNGRNKYFYLIRMLAFIRKYLKSEKPYTVLSFNEWTNPYVILASLGLSVPVFVSERMHPKARLPFISEILRRLLYRQACGIVTQTNYGNRVIREKTGAQNVVTIPNPVHPIEPIRCVKKKRIVSVGRLEKVKGHRYLIEAFSRINADGWELSLVGDGGEKLVKVLEIDNRVFFHGHLKNFSKQLSEATIFVLPSITEGFPNALIEAMSLPLACISTNSFCDKGDEIIQNGVNCLLVPPEDVGSMENAIRKLIRNEGYRKRLAAAAYSVRDSLSFEKIAGRYLDFIFQN